MTVARFVFLFFVLLFGGVWTTRVTEAQIQIEDFRPADTSSPRATLVSFLESTQAIAETIRHTKYFDRTSSRFRPITNRALDCLDDSELPEYARTEMLGEAAICLKEILDRVELPPLEDIPDAEAIEAMGGPDELPSWHLPGTRIFITRMTEGPRQHEYLFSARTVKSAKDIYVDIAPFAYREGGMPTSPGFHDWFKTSPSGPMTGKVIDMLPPFFKRMWGPLTVWMWFGLVLGVIITLGLMFTLYRIQRRIALKTKRSNIFTYCFSAVFSVAAALLPYLFSEFAAIYLCIRGTPLYVTSFACNFVSLLALLIVIFSFAMRFAEALIASPKINPRGLDAQVIRITSKLLALVISTVVFLEGGQFLGIPVTTLLASAGVGGVAVALAAQDTIKNVFATVTLMADRPFRIGERIVFNQYDGVVEEIGLRSTRVRLLNGHLTTIPNDVIASKDVENISRRPFIRRSSNIRLPLDTSPDKLQQALSIVRGAVNHHEGMDEDFPPRVYFDEINDNSFNLIFIYWFHPADYWSYLAFSEDVNLKITQGFEAAGIRFWIPTRLTKHSESDSAGPANDPWMRPEDGGSSSPLNQPNQDAGDAS